MSKGLVWRTVAPTLAAVLMLTACTPDGGDGLEDPESRGGPVIVGTTAQAVSLDPAAAQDSGSFLITRQIYPALLASVPESSGLKADLARTAEFTTPTEFTVELHEGMKWANGTVLDAGDVKFSFDRQRAINARDPKNVLAVVKSVSSPNATTVVFTLAPGQEHSFPRILAGPAALVVDDSVFRPDAITPDGEILAGRAFGGQFIVESYIPNALVALGRNAGYPGALGPAKSEAMTVKYYTDVQAMMTEVQQGSIDVALGAGGVADAGDLADARAISFRMVPGSEISYLAFDAQTLGRGEGPADGQKALAVRQAVAHAIDRSAFVEQARAGSSLPLYSLVPAGMAGAIEPFKSATGDGAGGPDVDRAAAALSEAGMTTPVALELLYNVQESGPAAEREFSVLKAQLETRGLFKVTGRQTTTLDQAAGGTAGAFSMSLRRHDSGVSTAEPYLMLGVQAAKPGTPPPEAVPGPGQDPKQRLRLLADEQLAAAHELAVVPLAQGTWLTVANPAVKGSAEVVGAGFSVNLAALSR